MVEYILGNFLISKGMMSEEKLAAILENQNQIRVKLGLIAVAEGFITMEQSEKINRLQATCDKRFGDIAIEEGYMTEEQLDKVLKLQGNAYLVFVQALVDNGVIKVDEIDNLWEEFRVQNGFGHTDIEALKDDDVDRIINVYVPQEAADYREIIGVAVRTIRRFIDRNVYIGDAELDAVIPYGEVVSQEMEANFEQVSAFIEAEDGMLNLASVYGREHFGTFNEDALDAAAEFLNCVNGLYAASSKEQFDLMPPRFKMADGNDFSRSCMIPVWINNSKMYFVVLR